MARRPNVSNQEIADIINLAESEKDDGGIALISKDSVIKNLHPDDQNADRVTRLLARRLKAKKISVVEKDDLFIFTFLNHEDSVNPSNPMEILRRDAEIQERVEGCGQTSITHDFVAPPNYADIKKAMFAGANVWLVGPAGCGKSLVAEDIALRHLKVPFIRKSVGGYTTPEEIIGSTELVPNEEIRANITRFIYGPLTELAEKGGVIILDEADCMSPETAACLQQILESGGKLVIRTEKGTKIIEKHPKFRIVFTANTDGHGDHTGHFAGAQVQNSALLDRIDIKISMDYNEVAEKRGYEEVYNIPSKAIELLFGRQLNGGIFGKIRQECAKADGLRTFLTGRMVFSFARYYKMYHGNKDDVTFSWHKTWNYTILNKMPEECRHLVCDIIRAEAGEHFDPRMTKSDILSSKAHLTDLIPLKKTFDALAEV